MTEPKLEIFHRRPATRSRCAVAGRRELQYANDCYVSAAAGTTSAGNRVPRNDFPTEVNAGREAARKG